MLYLRLSILHFLLFFLYGAVVPILSLFMIDYLGFSKAETGIVLAMSSLAAFVTPLLSAFITDRIFPAEKVFSIILIIGGICLWFLGSAMVFPVFLGIYTIYALSVGPASSLSNAIIFHHIPGGRNNYGKIRVWGTIGWIAVAWIFSWVWLQDFGAGHLPHRLPDALKLGALTAIALGVYSLTLPTSGVVSERRDKTLIPLDSLRVVRQGEVLLVFIAAMLYSITDRFFFYGAAPFLKNAGIPESWLLPVMSICQIFEIPAMFILGYLLKSWGRNKVLILGISANIIRYLLFTIGGSVPAYICGLIFHGVSYTFFSAGIFIYLDERSDRFSRAGVQLFYGINTGGIGNAAGYLLAGAVASVFMGSDGNPLYAYFWAVPLGLSIAIAAIIFLQLHLSSFKLFAGKR